MLLDVLKSLVGSLGEDEWGVEKAGKKVSQQGYGPA